jgi:transcriptional regulator with XRE-family HTH domain
MEEIRYNRIAAEMVEAGVSNQELAEAVGVHASHISDIRRNVKQPSWKLLYAIADYLKCDVRSLLVPNEQSPKKDVKF